jgi:hypothetical protein
MKLVSSLLIATLAAAPLAAQAPQTSIQASADRAVSTAAAEADSDVGRGSMFWSGLALGIAGVTTAVLGVTTKRIDGTSSGNAPDGAFQACVAQKSDPIYASNNCDALKGKNRALLWSGVAIGALGAALIVGSAQTRAELSPGVVRVLHTIRF